MQSAVSMVVLSVLAGGLLPLQFALNALLVRATGTSAVWAGCISVLVSTLALAMLAAATLPRWPSFTELVRVSPWLWTGGLLGALLVAASTFAIARVGAAVFFAAVFLGQLLVSLVLDHFGLLGLPVEPVTLVRIAGVGLIFMGLLALHAG